MQYTFLNFLCTSLIPELRADITAGSSCNIHLILISVAAVWAFPDKFTVFIGYNPDFPIVAAYLAVIALGI